MKRVVGRHAREAGRPSTTYKGRLGRHIEVTSRVYLRWYIERVTPRVYPRWCIREVYTQGIPQVVYERGV